MIPIIAMRNCGDETALRKIGAWAIAETNGQNYIQFFSLDKSFYGSMICISSIDVMLSHTAKFGWDVKVITETGTEFIGQVIP